MSLIHIGIIVIIKIIVINYCVKNIQHVENIYTFGPRFTGMLGEKGFARKPGSSKSGSDCNMKINNTIYHFYNINSRPCFTCPLSTSPLKLGHFLRDSHQEPTETSKQPIRTRYLGHVTGYQPIRDQYSLIRSIPGSHYQLCNMGVEHL
eukprot:sb/3473672/